MNVLMTGSNGLIGSALMPFLGRGGHQVRRLLRTESRESDTTLWDPANGTFAPGTFEGIDAVVHLAGEGIAGGRWTEGRKRSIRDSRVVGTRHLCEALAGLETPPSVLVAASAIGFYGDRGDELLDESALQGSGFLPNVCRAWEASVVPARTSGIRVVHLRLGIVLSPRGGALAKMLTPFTLGAGGVLGSGDQYMSWIGLEDLTRIIEYAIEQPAIQGAVNAVAPTPVTNAEFTRTLGHVLRRPTIFPVPGFGVRLLFGEMGDALLLGSTRVVPPRLSATGFTFEHADLDRALRAALA